MNLANKGVTIGKAYKPCAKLRATGIRSFGVTKKQKMPGKATPLATTAIAILINKKSVLCLSLAIKSNSLLALLFTHVVFLVLPHHRLQTSLKRGTGGRCLCRAHNFTHRQNVFVEILGLYCTTRKNDRCQKKGWCKRVGMYVRQPDADGKSISTTPQSQQKGTHTLPLA
jgi:hypothetical protein